MKIEITNESYKNKFDRELPFINLNGTRITMDEARSISQKLIDLYCEHDPHSPLDRARFDLRQAEEAIRKQGVEMEKARNTWWGKILDCIAVP